MRAFFLLLSRLQWLRRWMETSTVAQRVASRFVAGETLAQGLAVGRRINSEGIALTLDHLGENVTSLAEAEVSRDVYLRALTEIAKNRIDGNVSLKLTQFGMDISEQACRANVEQVKLPRPRWMRSCPTHGAFRQHRPGWLPGRRSAARLQRHGEDRSSVQQREPGLW